MHQSHHPTRRPARSRTLLVAVIAAVLLAPACTGGEQGSEASENATAQPETEAVITAETEASEAPDIPPSEASDIPPSEDRRGDATQGGEVAGIDLDAEYCEIATQAEELGMFSGEGPQSPEDLADAAERTRRITEALVRQAPAEIRDDVEVTARSLSDMLSVLEAHASRTGEVGPEAREDPDVQAAIDAFASRRVQRANDRVAEWQRENC